MNSLPDGLPHPVEPEADPFAPPLDPLEGPADDASASAETPRRRRPSNRTVAVALACLGATVMVLSGLTIALEQRRQSTEFEHQTCYARAAALAQVAAVEVARGSANPPEPGLLILECDKGAGFEP